MTSSVLRLIEKPRDLRGPGSLFLSAPRRPGDGGRGAAWRGPRVSELVSAPAAEHHRLP